MTAEAIERLQQTVRRLETEERPKIVADLSHALTLGDFSENAEYQDAKARLSRIDGRLFGLKERIKHAIPIERTENTTGRARIGSVVRVHANGKSRTYEILGSLESDPAKGRISHVSPLGKALLGRAAGEQVVIEAPAGPVTYEILEVS